MLILTRKVGETVMVGDNVSVTILGVKGNQVRVGINAPKDVSVHRKEIYTRIHQDGEVLQEFIPQEMRLQNARQELKQEETTT